MNLNKVKVYGRLRQFVGCSTFDVVVNSPIDVFRFLYCNFEGLEKHMMDQAYIVKVNNQTISEEELVLKKQGDIKIIPIACGAGPIFSVVAGIAGIVGGGAISKVGTGFLTKKIFGIGIGKIIGGAVSLVGTAMLNKGATALLAPTPKFIQPTSSISAINNQDSLVEDDSYNFSGISNVSRAGIAIPCIYGEIFVGSINVSNGIDTVQK
tara:strand:- start:306 stop:932 length:627 start_codon:yes stop_codon:yes gene_type:complete